MNEQLWERRFYWSKSLIQNTGNKSAFQYKLHDFFFLVLFCGSLHFLAIRIIAIFRVVVSQIVTPCPCDSEHGETVALKTEKCDNVAYGENTYYTDSGIVHIARPIQATTAYYKKNIQRTARMRIRLRECADWTGPLLLASAYIRFFFGGAILLYLPLLINSNAKMQALNVIGSKHHFLSYGCNSKHIHPLISGTLQAIYLLGNIAFEMVELALRYSDSLFHCWVNIGLT